MLFPFTTSTHYASDGIEEASDSLLISSPTWSISTENGNKYNNQLHYYEDYGWPEELEIKPQVLMAGPTSVRVSLTNYCLKILGKMLIYGSQGFERSKQSPKYEDKGVQAVQAVIKPSTSAHAIVNLCRCQQVLGANLQPNIVKVQAIAEIKGGGSKKPKEEHGGIYNVSSESKSYKENVLPHPQPRKRGAVTSSVQISTKRRKVEELFTQ